MSKPPPCPKCSSAYSYYDRNMFVCSECGHEWEETLKVDDSDGAVIVKDANGTQLADGDTVSVIKDLKLKASSAVIKVGSKVKNIRLVDGDHNIDCKIGGIGAIKLKSEFVKKV